MLCLLTGKFQSNRFLLTGFYCTTVDRTKIIIQPQNLQNCQQICNADSPNQFDSNNIETSRKNMDFDTGCVWSKFGEVVCLHQLNILYLLLNKFSTVLPSRNFRS